VLEQLADSRPARLAASARDNHAFHSGSFVHGAVTKWPSLQASARLTADGETNKDFDHD